jgi:tripartite-type tricarboxylate transporter receptor subunit TctC
VKNRRDILKALMAGAATAAFPLSAAAQSYPSRPIRLISPWSAGGTSDLVLRAFAESAAKRLGTHFIVENKPGAGGTLGAVELVRAQPDGYTLSQLALSVFSLPHMQQTQFDPLKDITYISRLTTYTNGLVVRADSPIKSVKDLVDYAKANPGRFTYATSGIGSSPHLSVEEFAGRAAIQLVNVPYKADSESLLALLSGQVDALSGTTSWGPHVDGGKLRLVAIYGSKRAKRWPNAPTLNELGYAVPDTPYGVGGPKGMDPAIVKRLQDVFRATLDDPAVQATLDKYDMPSAYLDAAEYAKNAREMFQQQGVMIKRLGLKS